MASNTKISNWLACVLLLWAATTAVSGKRTLDRCSLAREMHALGVPKGELARWACIAQHESSYRTWVVGPANKDGTNDYGIFQINDHFWCQPSNGKHSHNGCHINCNELLTDKIAASVKCARRVQRKQGWTAWSVFNRYCSGSLPSIDDCFKINIESDEDAEEYDYGTFMEAD